MPSASDKRPAGPEPGKDLSFESIAAGEKASEAEDFVRDTIERRPYTAAAVALAVGNLLLTLFGGAWIILGNPSVTGGRRP
jgi:hypothetical protein